MAPTGGRENEQAPAPKDSDHGVAHNRLSSRDFHHFPDEKTSTTDVCA